MTILCFTDNIDLVQGIAPTLILVRVRVSMGVSFHDQPSLVEAVGSLRFNAVDDPNPNLGTGTISQDGSLGIGLDGLNVGLEVVNTNQERGDDGVGGSDEIQMVYV